MNEYKASAASASFKATLCLALLLFLAGCSLPRIIVLNDPLSAEDRVKLGRIYESQGKTEPACASNTRPQSRRIRSASPPRFFSAIFPSGAGIMKQPNRAIKRPLRCKGLRTAAFTITCALRT